MDSALDEFGWDPFVDKFLRALVRRSPCTDFGVVDFAWVSSRCLEILEPSEDQIIGAVQQFSPPALEQRWLYLQGLPHESSDDEEFADIFNVGVEEEDSGDEVLRNSGNRTEVSVIDEPQQGCASRGVPSRSRVLDAMQGYLFGRSSNRSDARVTPCPETIAGPSSEKSNVESATQPSSVDTCNPDRGFESAGAAPQRAVAQASSVSGGGKSENIALRRCLDELLWHGEALHRCASGEDAAAICVEAAVRRKSLLWFLGAGSDSSM